MRFDVRRAPNNSRGCVKSAAMKSGNDQIVAVRHFDVSSRWTGWSKNEFPHRLSLQALGSLYHTSHETT